MKIIFKLITIQNFMSFSNEVIKLDDRGYVKVSGKNKCDVDKAYSNGSGKSSIWESISWCLTGQTIRGTKEITNFYGDDGALVSLDMEVDDVPYTITRAKDHSKYKTSLKIIKDGEDVSGKGIRDTEQLLLQYFPDLTSTLIGSVILLGQGLPQRFSNNTPSGRKEVLESLSKSDFMIDDIKQRLNDRINLVSTNVNTTKDDIIINSGKCDYLQTQRKTSQDVLNSLLDVSELQIEIGQLNNKIQSDREEITNHEIEIDKLRKSRDRINETIKALNSNYRNDISSINMEYDADLVTTRKALSLVIGELSKAKSELQTIKSIKDTCPTCGQKIQGVEKPDVTPYEEEVKKLETNYKNLQDSIDVVESERRQKLKDCDSKYIQMIDTNNTLLESCEATIKEHERGVDVINADIMRCQTRYDKINAELLSHKQVYDYHSNIIANTTLEIEELEQKILYSNMNLNKLEGKLKVLNKINTIVKRDFRGVLLSSVIDYINIKLREYSIDVFDGDSVRIELNGNNLDILYCNKHYESLSGGERQKIDVLIQFAIREMLCNRIGFSSNIIVLDELFDNLDSTGCDKIINLISNKLSDISSIFIITHHTDIVIPSDSIIEVEKNNNGVSKIVKDDI